LLLSTQPDTSSCGSHEAAIAAAEIAAKSVAMPPSSVANNAAAQQVDGVDAAVKLPAAVAAVVQGQDTTHGDISTAGPGSHQQSPAVMAAAAVAAVAQGQHQTTQCDISTAGGETGGGSGHTTIRRTTAAAVANWLGDMWWTLTG
jgi:hypothetical protein